MYNFWLAYKVSCVCRGSRKRDVITAGAYGRLTAIYFAAAYSGALLTALRPVIITGGYVRSHSQTNVIETLIVKYLCLCLVKTWVM